jgi:uncharacterized phage-associated protein
VYYSQAWSLVWDEEEPLFKDDIEAWANGPVVPKLYKAHKGQFSLSDWPSGNIGNLNDKQKETIDAVLKFYGGRPAQWLSDLTHREDPWIKARGNMPDGKRGNKVITLAIMHEYYSALQ